MTTPSILPAATAEAVGRRLMERPTPYCPWFDLRSRTGVDLRWHSGQVSKWSRPHGVTTFSELAISLHVGLQECQIRSTLTHELVHLERGPRPKGSSEARDENRVDQIAAMRLVDPVLFEILGDHIWNHQVRRRLLGVDFRMLKKYAAWRKRASSRTALQRWEEYGQDLDRLPAWPPSWVKPESSAHNFAGPRAARR